MRLKSYCVFVGDTKRVVSGRLAATSNGTTVWWEPLQKVVFALHMYA
jgi:hypothetical protein